jgi:hypothetical protein
VKGPKIFKTKLFFIHLKLHFYYLQVSQDIFELKTNFRSNCHELVDKIRSEKIDQNSLK